MIRFECKCGKKFKVDDKSAGKKGKCSQCKAVVKIPESDNDSEVKLAPQDNVIAEPVVSISHEGEVVFKGSHNHVVDVIKQTVEELKGKIIKFDFQNGYIESKFRYGINPFGIRVCVYIRNDGQQCVIGFQGKLKDAIDTLNHARKKAEEVKARFVQKLEASSAPVQVSKQQFDCQPQTAMPNTNTGNIINVNIPPVNSHTPLSAQGYDKYHDVPLAAGWVIAGWIASLLIPIVGLVFGIVCCTKKRVGNGVGMIVLSIFAWIIGTVIFM